MYTSSSATLTCKIDRQCPRPENWSEQVVESSDNCQPRLTPERHHPKGMLCCQDGPSRLKSPGFGSHLGPFRNWGPSQRKYLVLQNYMATVEGMNYKYCVHSVSGSNDINQALLLLLSSLYYLPRYLFDTSYIPLYIGLYQPIRRYPDSYCSSSSLSVWCSRPTNRRTKMTAAMATKATWRSNKTNPSFTSPATSNIYGVPLLPWIRNPRTQN